MRMYLFSNNKNLIQFIILLFFCECCNNNQGNTNSEIDNKHINNEIENKQKYNNNIEQYNIHVFEDTKKICLENKIVKRNIESSIKRQKFIDENQPIKIKQINNRLTGNIELKNDKTIHCALEYLNGYKGCRVAILNFADWLDKGGCVNSGLTTQEESICRCTTLYQNLINDNVSQYYISHNEKYKKDKKSIVYANNDIIYSPDVQILKDDKISWSVQNIDHTNARFVDVITCAAPWNISHGITLTNQEIYDIHTDKINRILQIAQHNNVDIIILGAHGCGAFNNNPEIVAKAYKTIINKYKSNFKKIVFAIPIINGKSNNYDIFKSVLF